MILIALFVHRPPGETLALNILLIKQRYNLNYLKPVMAKGQRIVTPTFSDKNNINNNYYVVYSTWQVATMRLYPRPLQR